AGGVADRVGRAGDGAGRAGDGDRARGGDIGVVDLAVVDGHPAGAVRADVAGRCVAHRHGRGGGVVAVVAGVGGDRLDAAGDVELLDVEDHLLAELAGEQAVADAVGGRRAGTVVVGAALGLGPDVGLVLLQGGHVQQPAFVARGDVVGRGRGAGVGDVGAAEGGELRRLHQVRDVVLVGDD